METELHMFVPGRVAVKAPLVQASLVRITGTWTRTRTRISANVA